MRLALTIDSYTVQIDTRDPELLARWLLEQFALIRWTGATQVRAQAWPSFADFTEQGTPRADWLADSRYVIERWTVKEPAEVVAAMQDVLNRFNQGRPSA
jgi:hypothetical protein